MEAKIIVLCISLHYRFCFI